MIEKLYKTKNYVESLNAISNNRCNRCMGNNLYKDFYGIYHCLDCNSYGEISEDTIIYRYIRKIEKYIHVIVMDYDLSKKQKLGSEFLVSCYINKKAALLQAVCGAGKTEMTYKVILNALNENKKVCFVLPRVEVLKEVFVRFKNHFPKTTMSILFEGHKNYQNANLLFSTPQQLICFHKEFDLLIIDEVDAFPYANNILLERLVNKSVKKRGVIFYMSATITNKFRIKIDNKLIEYFLIPSRFHLRPLPVPKFIHIKKSKNKLKELLTLVKLNSNLCRQSLIFVSTINEGHILKRILDNSKLNCEFISSISRNKNQVIKQFRRKDYLFLISTTILERGVTFNNIDCFVFKSDHKVFTKESLIQISGRVGRLINDYSGKIFFLSEYVSKNMKKAKKEILFMNKKNSNEM